jgi:ABC-2 type transport system permease protein
MVQAAISIAVLLVVAVLLGFRPSAGPVEWLGVIGLLAIASFALIWLAVALGMVTNSVETASNLPHAHGLDARPAEALRRVPTCRNAR